MLSKQWFFQPGTTYLQAHPPHKQRNSICQLLPSQTRTSRHQACLSLFVLSWFFYIHIHTVYIYTFCVCRDIYIKTKQHTSTQYASVTTTFLPIPYNLFTLGGQLFPPCFLLNWNYPFKVSAFINPHFLFGNWGKSSLPSEAPSHLNTMLVLPPATPQSHRTNNKATLSAT